MLLIYSNLENSIGGEKLVIKEVSVIVTVKKQR